MADDVVIVGAGMGGLVSAIRLARKGRKVRVIEARSRPGGLASGFAARAEGGPELGYDAGPYILLDRPGLEWALAQIGQADLLSRLDLVTIRDVYEVRADGAPPVRILADLDATAAGIDRTFPGAGMRYVRYVREVAAVHKRLLPLLFVSRPGVRDLLRTRAFLAAPFLLRSLKAVLDRTGLPKPVVDALGIWTHVAGQTMAEAPSPLAFVPALIHTVGCFYPKGGIRAIPDALYEAGKAAGVEFQFDTKIKKIRVESGRVHGVDLDSGEFLPCRTVLSNASGVGTYLDLVPMPEKDKRAYRDLPLQSPGVAAYMAIRDTDPTGPYLKFRLPEGDFCQLLLRPGSVVPEIAKEGWSPARLLQPTKHAEAERMGVAGQEKRLSRLVAEPWWRDGVADFKVVGTRIPAQWGAQYHLHRDSMNPVMTARFMRRGRVAHRSPHADGLYLAGSSTHPGQWVSFCAISGVLAADRLIADRV